MTGEAAKTPRPARRIPAAGAAQLLLTLAIGITAMQPALRGGLVRGADMLLHFYRVVALDDLMRQGVFFTRWFPNLAFGYGYPIFHYYPPLPHYLAQTVNALTGSPVAGLSAAFVMFSCAGAFGMFGWVRRIAGPAAGLAAAVAYAFAPYTLFNTFNRAALGEFAALALIPVALWALHRTREHGVRGAAPVALAYAGIMLSHNITALIATPMLLIYALALSWPRNAIPGEITASPRHARGSRDFARTLLLPSSTFAALALGLALAAFFWLPAFVERDLTRLDDALGRAYDFRAGFVTPAQLFTLPHAIDPLLFNDQVRPALHSAVIGIGVLTLLLALRADRIWRMHAILGLLLTAIAALMATAWSQPVWDALPLLRFVLYPFRFLGFASIGAALLIGLCVGWLARRAPRAGNIAALVGALAVMAAGVTWQLPAYFPAALPKTAGDIHTAERALGIIGTTSIGEYAPRTVETWPAVNADPAQPFQLHPGLNIASLQSAPLRIDATVRSDADTVLVVNQFMFEGWRATRNREPVVLRATQPEGLIALDLPAGEHTLALWFDSTPLRDLANTISLGAALLLGATLVFRRDALPSPRSGDGSASRPSTVLLTDAAAPQLLLAGAALVTAFGLLKHIWIDTSSNPWRAPAPALVNARPLVSFGGEAQLLDASTAIYDPASNSLRVALYWQPMRAPMRDLGINLTVIDRVGEPIVGIDHVHPDNAFPFSRMTPNDIVRDSYVLTLPPGTPPGRYTLHAALYPYGAADQRLNIDGGTARDAKAVSIDVQRPTQPAQPTALALDTRLDASLGGGLTLIGHSLPLKQVRVGEAYPLTLGWRIDASWPGAGDVCFEARRAARHVDLGCQSLPPGWQVRDVWRLPYRVHLSPALEDGVHELVLRVGTREHVLGAVKIDTPPRVLTQPPVQTEQRAAFADAGELVGYSAPPTATAGTRLPVTLVWSGARETERKYTVFVHLIDDAGERRAGHDGEPDGGAQPTSTWLSGAYISDRHELELPPDLPPGVYRLVVGMYDSFTFERLPLVNGKSQVQLRGEITITRAAP